MTNLPRPDFIDRDPQQVETEAIALYEETTDKKLYPAQPERLLLDVLSFRETLVRLAIQDAAEQNLVNYARGVNLDHLGALLAVERLPAAPARTTLQFTKDPGATSSSVIVPAGTRAQSFDGKALFATEKDLVIPVGQTSGSVFASASLAGTTGNGYDPGELNVLADPVPSVASVTNTTLSRDGADIEIDDRLRQRIKLAPNQFSVAGSYGAYLYWILTASQTIIDAAIISPGRVQVKIYPLTTTGLPGSEILSQVAAIVSSERVRPLTDDVEVLSPTQVAWTINAAVTLYSDADPSLLQTQLNDAASAFAATKRAKLGQDIIRTQLIAALSLSGVYNVTLTSPVADIIVSPSQWANCTSITVSIAGTNDG